MNFPTFYDNELIPGLVQALTTQDEGFDELITSSSFLPRVQLFGSTSNAVKEDRIGQGRFGIVRGKDTIEELGKTFDCCPIAFRLKAMQIAGDEVISIYDHKSPEFIRIQGESELPNTGCMYGVEFLLWLPSIGEFVTYFLSSKSSRREAKPLRALIGKAATLVADLVKTKKHSWFAPKVQACATPPVRLPDPTAMHKEIDRFVNPKSSTTEAASKEEAAAVSDERQ